MQTPQTEPENFTPGDTLLFLICEKGYSSKENWRLYYSLRGPQVINFNSIADGAGAHLIEVSATVTKNWVGGFYFWQCQIVNSVTDQTFTLRRGRVKFLANYSSVTDEGYSDISPAEEALQNLLAYDGAVRAGVDPKNIDPTVMRYQIDGVEVIRFDPEQRIMLIQKFERIVAKEKRAANLATGRKPRNKVLVKFIR